MAEAFSALRRGAVGPAREALGAARQALEQMNRDIGEDAPPTPDELADLLGHIENMEGAILLDLGDLRGAVEHLQCATDQFRKTDNEALPMAINSLGIACRRLGRTEEALACYQEAMDLFAANGDELNAGMLQQNAGNLCQSVNRHEEAIEWYTKASDGFARLNRKDKMAEVQLSLAQSCLVLQDWDKAESAYRTARDHYAGERNEALVAAIDHNLTSIASKMPTGFGRSDRAVEHIKECLRRYSSGHDAPGLQSLLFDSSVRVLDLFPAVSDEMFEWFVGLTKRSAQGSGLQKALPMRWALETLNAICVRVRESSPNQYMAEFMLAAWSVKYRTAFDEHFFAGLQNLKLAAAAMYPAVEAQQTNIQRLQVIEGLCRENDEEIFSRYPQMREMVSRLRRKE
ncbi:MAG: tetratricopeptide repeat protein [Pirellulales bacterium]|nr:tetratricopeptide repeat protein [Pirellulales bacterium]